MGTEKVSRLILKTGVPLRLSLLINSLYNFVDSVFVSRVAEDALTALSLAGPVLLALALSAFGRLELVWLAFSAAEVLCIPLAARLWRSGFERRTGGIV